MCALIRTYVYYLHESTNHVDLPELPPSRPRGRSHSQCCCVAFSGAVIAITTTSSSFLSCVRLPRLYPCMYVYLPKFSTQMHYYDTYRSSTMRIFLTVNIIFCFGTKYDANVEIMSCQVLFCQPLHTSRSEEKLKSTVQNTIFARFSLISLSIHPRSRRDAEQIRQGEGRWSRPPKTALEHSDLAEKFQFRASILRPRRMNS